MINAALTKQSRIESFTEENACQFLDLSRTHCCFGVSTYPLQSSAGALHFMKFSFSISIIEVIRQPLYVQEE